MVSHSRKVIIDILVALLLLYSSIWLYELTNLLTLSLAGHQASISFSGFLPLGATSMSDSSSGMAYAKLLQVGLCSTTGVAVIILAGRLHLVFTQLAGLSVLAVFLGSVYWEELCIASSNYVLHVMVFVGVAGVMNTAMLLFRSRKQL